jgi:hypothetical protein
VVLVDQAGLDRVGGEVGTAHTDVAFGSRLHTPNFIGAEGSFDCSSLACQLRLLPCGPIPST